MNSKIIEAIEKQLLIEFQYEGESRTVEPHCYGLTTKGNEAIRAYQVDGYSSSGGYPWRMYTLSKVDDLEVLDETFEVRDDYKKGDKGMSKIYKEI